MALAKNKEVAPPSATAAGTTVVPIVEENARIETREVEQGRVRVTTRTELVEESVRGDVETERVKVKTVEVNRTLNPGEPVPGVRTEGPITIVPVLEEVLVVEKRLLLKEELHITRETTTEHVDVPITLRKQRAVVERTEPQKS